MFGYAKNEALGQHISLIMPSERMEEEAFINKEIALGNRVSHFETTHVSKTGTLVAISL